MAFKFTQDWNKSHKSLRQTLCLLQATVPHKVFHVSAAMEKWTDFLLPVPLLKVHSWISFSKHLLLTFNLHLFIVSLYPFVLNPTLPYGLHSSSTLTLTLWVYISSKKLCTPRLNFIRLSTSSFCSSCENGAPPSWSARHSLPTVCWA